MRQSRPNKPTRWEPRWTRLLGDGAQRAEAEDSGAAAETATDATGWRAEEQSMERPRDGRKPLASVVGIVLAPVIAALILWHVTGLAIEALTRPGAGGATALPASPTAAPRATATAAATRGVVTIPIATAAVTPAAPTPAVTTAPTIAATAAPATAMPTHASAVTPRVTPRATSSPPAAQAAQPTTQSLRSHLVERGDTLFSIARRNGTTVSALVAANGLPSPDAVLPVGKRIMIP